MSEWRPVLRLEWAWEGGDGRVADARLPALLAAVSATGSLRRAARTCGLSYRHAWTLLQPWTEPAEHALLAMKRGHGATLTPRGEALLGLERAAQDPIRELAPRLDAIAATHGAAYGARHVCEASHDLALVSLPECARANGLALDLKFRGSSDAVAALSAGRCAIAGFHVPLARAHPLRRTLLAPLLALARDVDIAIVPVLRRTQGLIIAKRNPRRLSALADLTGRGVRFVNRQRGAGTRLLLDTLLAEAGIAPRAITGYEHEEFTHAAVAATVAAGGAHAGFGIAAAAVQFGLGFVPLAEETYALAFRRDALTARDEAMLVATLRARSWRDSVGRMPGYRAPARPSVQSLDRFVG